MHSRHPLFTVLLLLALLTLASCGGSDGPSDSPLDPEVPTDPDDPDDPDPPADSDSDFECERQGYPCAWSDVDPDVFDRSDELADEAYQRLHDGDAASSVAASLEAEDDVVHVMASEDAIRFRVEDGRPYWVFGPGAITSPGPAAAEAQATRIGADVGSGEGSSDNRSAPARAVVGDQPKSKRALVLSPYAYEFGASDDAGDIAALLGGARGYEGNVELVANTQTDAAVTQSHFGNWDSYDVVHVSSHGTQVCRDGECQTVISGGKTSRELILSGDGTGIDAVKIRYGEHSSGAGQDYFRENYPEGLSDTIVFVSACKSMKGTDLAELLAGDDGAYVGWDEAVDPGVAKAAAVAFFQELVQRGVTTAKAYSSVQDEGLTVDPPEAGDEEAVLQLYSGGADLRIREVAWIRNPLTRAQLPSEAPYPVVGEPEDGNPDDIPFLIEVDGVDGDPSGFTVHVEVNGFSGDPAPLQEGEAVDGEGNVWRVKGEVPVTFDAEQGQPVEIQVRVDLPEGEQSEWDEDTDLGNPALRFTSEIESLATSDTYARLFSRLEAEEFDLSFDPDLGSLTGDDVLEYAQYSLEVSAPCTLTSTSTTDGTIEVTEASFSSSEDRPVGLEELVLVIPPGPTESHTFVCPQVGGGSFNGQIHWFAGFMSFHGGQLCGAPVDLEQGRGLVLKEWEPGSGDVLARREYDRSCAMGDATFSETTTIELIDPTES